VSPHPVEIGTTRVASLNNVRAVITTKWERGYTKKVIRQVESFYIDSSLDNDADNWHLEIGDPNGEFLAMMDRNNEVRVEILSTDPGFPGHLMTGIADDLTYDQDGMYQITGRDYAALALDSTCPGKVWKKVKPKYVIANQARQLGFPGVSLNELPTQQMYKKVIKTDGSETYWEFWYRLYRVERMYLWVNPNGTLIGNRLYYNALPSYYFGTAANSDNARVKEMHLPVEGVEIRKTTQSRVSDCWVYVHNGKDTFLVKTGVTDPTISDWIKRPLKLIQDTNSHTEQGARKKAWEEIYEGKVGSFEIKVVLANTNFVIQPNRMCRLRIPELGIAGFYFIVGTRVQAGPDGYVQEIRLREKDIALSRRVPEQPKIKSTLKKVPALGTPDHQYPIDQFQDQKDQTIHVLTPLNTPVADYFWKAAMEFHDPWDFDTFLGSILSIGYIETGISNIRQDGMNVGRDRQTWHNPSGPAWATNIFNSIAAIISAVTRSLAGNPEKDEHPGDPNAVTQRQFILDFVNEQNTLGLKVEAGVGIMQLTYRPTKEKADDYFDNKIAGSRGLDKQGHNQWLGGRWDLEANIHTGAEYFRSCLDTSGLSPVSADQIQAMCTAASIYNHGHYVPGSDYEKKFRKALLTDPGYLQRAKDADAAVRAATPSDKITEGATASKIMPDGWPNEEQCIAAFSGIWQGNDTAAVDPIGDIPFLQAAQYRANRTAQINLIVIHDMEMDQTNEAAQNCANGFASSTRLASAHYTIDNQHVVQCVRDNDVAFGSCGTIGASSVNDLALHFEHAGYAGPDPPASDWTNTFSVDMLKRSAALTRKLADKYGVPRVHLSTAAISAGQSGFVGHGDLTTALGLTGDCAHTDPGSSFPWATYMGYVNA